MNSSQIIQKNIRYLRTTLGITQEQLAFISGLTSACVSRLERDSKCNPKGFVPFVNIPVQTLDHIAEGLKIQTAQLFDEQLASEEGKCITELQRCMNEIMKLDVDKQRDVIHLLDNYIQLGQIF